jgi:DNA polymerase V
MLFDVSLLPKNNILCVDMKSFYASCECVDHGLDPLNDYVVVVSDKTRSGSVVLAASPKMKSKYGIKTGSRLFEVPRHRHIYIFNARMKRYLEVSVQITELFLSFVPFEAILTYSVDESWLTLNGTEKLHGTPREAAQKIRRAIWNQFGLPSCIGIGPNRFISKVVLDAYAKNQGVAECTYEEVPKKLWPLPLRKIWGIGVKMEQHLNNMGMYTLGDVANSTLERLRKRFGVIGEQLYYHAWGIDLSPIFVEANDLPQKSIGKGVTLLRDYWRENEILTVVLELCEEVAKRARQLGKVGRTVSFGVRYSHYEKGGFHQSVTLDTGTNLTMELYRVCKQIFKKFYDGRSVRMIHVSLSNLMNEESVQLSLFENREKERTLAKAMDEIRDKFGSNALLRAASYTSGSLARIRNGYIGGHKA